MYDAFGMCMRCQQNPRELYILVCQDCLDKEEIQLINERLESGL